MHPALVVFEQVARIPHSSYNEKRLSDFVFGYALDKGLEAVQDDALNVLVRVPGSAGYEQSPPVILQGHLDMVAEKALGSAHDFLSDPIRLVYDGDTLRADGTTLGADDAVAVSYALALLEDPAPHPPLEMLFTVEEEVSMKGVKSFDPTFFQGRQLINLDSAGEGQITVSCAGGVGVDYFAKLPLMPAAGRTFALDVSGLLGGHSGGEIHRERANAIKLLCRALLDLLSISGVEVAHLEGGTKSNAIPVSARAILAVSDDALAEVNARVSRWADTFREECEASDPGVCLCLTEADVRADYAFERSAALRLIKAVHVTPTGPARRNPELSTVIASNSIGILRTHADEVLVQNNLRANADTQLEEMALGCELIAEAFGLSSRRITPYPGWAFRADSRLQSAAAAAWAQTHDEPLKRIAIHAGLEVGFIAQKLPGLDAISLGPDTTGAHTPYEQMSVSSFERTYGFLLSILERLK